MRAGPPGARQRQRRGRRGAVRRVRHHGGGGEARFRARARQEKIPLHQIQQHVSAAAAWHDMTCYDMPGLSWYAHHRVIGAFGTSSKFLRGALQRPSTTSCVGFACLGSSPSPVSHLCRVHARIWCDGCGMFRYLMYPFPGVHLDRYLPACRIPPPKSRSNVFSLLVHPCEFPNTCEQSRVTWHHGHSDI